MLKKFILWFMCFGCSFLVESIGWTEQGKAFLIIYLATDVLTIVLFSILYSLLEDDLKEIIKNPKQTIMNFEINIIIMLLITWGIKEFLNLDCYVVFQIIAFAECFVPPIPKKE